MQWFSSFILILAHLFGAESIETDNPFALAHIAPEDAKLFIHIENAAAIRNELADRPIAEWVNSLVEGGEAGKVWNTLASASEMDPERLFDVCFGQRSTMIVRREGEAAQWALLTEMPADGAARIIDKLRPVSRGPRHNMAIYDLPEHDLLVARRQQSDGQHGELVVIGPKADLTLFRHVIRSLNKPGKTTLAELPAIERGHSLGPGFIGIYMSHEPPLGGWSVAVAQLNDSSIAIRHHGSFANAPFQRSVSKQHVYPNLLQKFADQSLLAVIEPNDVGGGQVEMFVRASLGMDLLGRAIRRNLGDHRIVVIGEVEGRQEDDPIDLHLTTVAVCLELNNAEIAEAQFDRQMTALAKRLNVIGQGRFSIEVPCDTSFESGQPRSIDISPAAKWLTGNLPIAHPITLNWSVVVADRAESDEAASGWAVIATHPQHLSDCVRALQQHVEHGDRGWAQSTGIANGGRISHHLRSWSDRPELFADPENHKQLEEFRNSLLMMSRFAASIDRAQWHLARPCGNDMCLYVNIELAEPKSARE